MATALPCVCGCRKGKHHKTRISVNLKAKPDPIYPLPPASCFSRFSAYASYYSLKCSSCDCGDYLADTDAPVAGRSRAPE